MNNFTQILVHHKNTNNVIVEAMMSSAPPPSPSTLENTVDRKWIEWTRVIEVDPHLLFR